MMTIPENNMQFKKFTNCFLGTLSWIKACKTIDANKHDKLIANLDGSSWLL